MAGRLRVKSCHPCECWRGCRAERVRCPMPSVPLARTPCKEKDLGSACNVTVSQRLTMWVTGCVTGHDRSDVGSSRAALVFSGHQLRFLYIVFMKMCSEQHQQQVNGLKLSRPQPNGPGLSSSSRAAPRARPHARAQLQHDCLDPVSSRRTSGVIKTHIHIHTLTLTPWRVSQCGFGEHNMQV